jgi:cytochrome b561
MGLRTTPPRYGVGAKAFHWLTVMLVLAAYLLSKGDRYSLYSAGAHGLRRLHETLGLLVFIVVVLRLLWRLIDGTPAMPPTPRWMATAAKLVQFALYALLITIPATAVLGTWLEGLPVTLLGFDTVPQIAQAHGLGQLITKIHTALAVSIPDQVQVAYSRDARLAGLSWRSMMLDISAISHCSISCTKTCVPR